MSTQSKTGALTDDGSGCPVTEVSQQIPHAKLLLVDDEPHNVRMLERVLKAGGYTQTHGVTDSREVGTLVRAHEFDLVLLDLRMPIIDGFAVMQDLRAHAVSVNDYVPILVLTGQDDPQSKLRALEMGAQDFLVKPYDRTEVLTRVRNLLEVRLLHKQVRNQNALLERKVRERTHELEETRLEIIRRLGTAAEYRDNETGMHIMRISLFAQAVALHLRLGQKRADLIMNASPMHDIGKIGIPDRILLKPGALTDEEWRIMRSHTEIGAKVLSGHGSGLLRMAAEIALCHHERWDGSGYPQGLSGEAIPIEARIVAIVDVFDALTSERPYKRAWTEQEAIAKIQEGAGSHFDPVVATAFMEILPELLEIKRRYTEPRTTA